MTPVTQILQFTAVPNPAPVGGTSRLSWHAVHAASVPGASSCSLVRRLENASASEPAREVPCQGTWDITVNENVTFQLDVLKRPHDPGDPFLVALVTITTSDAPQAVTVTLAPTAANLQAQQTQAFTATVTGTDDTRVTWGTTCGSITDGGNTITYTAPDAVGTCILTATSVAAPTRLASATITVTDGGSPGPVTVTVEPLAATLRVNESRTFAATVTGTTDTRLDWDASCGIITGAGNTITYTAPDTPRTCTLTATSQVDIGASGTATVVVKPAPIPLLIEVDTNLVAGTTVSLPLRGTVNVTVDWGDGQTSSTTASGDLPHTYASDGRYAIRITGDLGQFGNGLDGYPHADAITGVSAWGELGLTSLSGAFRMARSLTTVPTDLPGTVTDLSGMFFAAIAFDQPIGNWDTSNVTNMSSLFANAYAFNQPIGNWNTSNVSNMTAMFASALAFNQPIGNWNTNNVTDMSGMFADARAFNQPIGSWNTSNVADMGWMFSRAWAFDQPIGSWNTGNVTDMKLMFYDARVFNQPIGNWNTHNVTDMSEMFGRARSFSRPIGTWNTSGVTSMSAMFSGASAFDQPIGTWDTRNVIDMRWMFGYATSFNRDLSTWCVTNITSSPEYFDHDATSWTLPRPIWGTCP